jgi:hypothetical protein
MGSDDVWLKNVGVMYQWTMNLIFHDLLGIILEVYIDDVVVKWAGLRVTWLTYVWHLKE